MSDSAVFQKNKERWSLFYPHQAHQLHSFSNQQLTLTSLENQENNLENRQDQTSFYAYSPSTQALEDFKKLDLKGKQILFVYGVGLGYFYEAAKAWLHQSDQFHLVFLEDDLEVIYYLLQTDQGTAILHDKQVWLVPVEETSFALENLSANFVLKPYLFTALPYYQQRKKEKFDQLATKYAFYLNLRAGISLEYSDYGRAFFANFFRNLFLLPSSYLANRLFNRFRGIPAIICGAGPSLEKNKEVLKNLEDRALIFAGGTAMNGLNVKGIMPHFGVGIDPNSTQFTRLIMNNAYQVPFFYRNRFLHEALEIIQGEHLYVTGSSGYPIGEWIEQKLGIETAQVEEGHNVLNFSVSLAAAMGCNPIILVGIDLAYTQNQSYVSGIVNHPLHDKRQNFHTKTAEEELINYRDIYGEPTLTLWKWISESLWYTQFAKTNTSIKLINATEGGIGFKEIDNEPLQEVAERLLTKQYDLNGMVAAAIQQAYLPAEVTSQKISQTVEEILVSLKKLEKLFSSICIEFEKTEFKLKQKQTLSANSLSDEAIQALSEIEEEIAYVHLLKVFNDNYLDRFTGEFQRLKYDEQLLSPEELALKRLKLNSSRYKFLKNTTLSTISIVETILNHQNESNHFHVASLPSLENSLTVHSTAINDHYFFDQQLFIIRDAELNLAYREELIADQVVEHKTFYPNGTIQQCAYWLQSRLHGPSTYYDEQGQLLAESWFIKGLRQGKVKKYYKAHSLHSVEQWLEGKKEGLQLYYYPNGILKSSLNYSQGYLQGLVQIYHSNGQLKRELYFNHHKRQGLERIWDERGTLLVEAEFDGDKPVGVAKKWYPTGNIAVEVTYEKETDNFIKKEWNTVGQAILHEKYSSTDFFDQVVNQTDKLTENLKVVLNQINHIKPLLDQADQQAKRLDQHNPLPKDLSLIDRSPHELVEEESSLYTDMQRLTTNLLRLDEINKKLAFESGLDPANKEEAIWKTPSSRKIVEKEVSKLTEKMTEEMFHIQNSLITVVGLLTKKIQPSDKEEF